QYKGEQLSSRIPALLNKLAESGGRLKNTLVADHNTVIALDAAGAGCSAAEDSNVSPRPDDVVMMILTSGSTSFPKPALHTHESILCGAAHYADGLEVTVEDVFLHMMPNYHVGSIATALLTLMRGARLELLEFFEPAETLRRIEESAATLIWGFDTHFLMMRDDPGYQPAMLSSLQRTMVAA